MDIRLSSGQTLDLLRGESILQALKRQEVYLLASCGGKQVCGKCRVQVLEGDFRAESKGKLTPAEVEKGFVLACHTYPESDILIDIPKESRLVIGDAIEVSRGDSLAELFRSMEGKRSPVVRWLTLDVPPPTIEDNISDLERLKRALPDDLGAMKFSHAFVSSLAARMRGADWKVRLGYIQGPEAVFLTDSVDRKGYGVAVDIGTTTLVIYLVNLTDGSLVDVGSTYNSQIRHGDDVITRIVFATEGGGLKELKETVVSDINSLIAPIVERHSLALDEIESVVIAGNTTMAHLFWGFDPSYIREEPYTPTVNTFPLWKAEIAGLLVNDRSPVFTLPCVASYIGGDIVAGVLASKMHRADEVSLFMDIGTNGEIVIGNREWLMTAACSAGPCFEGSGIKHGMRATEGAVESVRIDAHTFEPSMGVIGGGPPVGICGSGMIDAVTEMFLTGVIDRKGKFVKGLETDRIRSGFDGQEFLFFRNERGDLVLTEIDIENIMRAKAAVYAGVSLLLSDVGLAFSDIERVYIAGGFGNYLNVEKAVTIGMLPDMPREKFVFLGNTSVVGAYLCLLSEEMRDEAGEIAKKMTNVELSVSSRFMDEYMSALFLPHTDITRFPTVERLLNTRE